jgi:hypothetical protein
MFDRGLSFGTRIVQNDTKSQAVGVVDGKAPGARTKRLDLTGKGFGKLIAKEYLGSSKWSCVCECGAYTTVRTKSLMSGNTSSCGKHRLPRDTGTMSKLYRSWSGMLARCRNPRHKSYPQYGGSGIVVCGEWGQFREFRTWALSHGYLDGLTLDRVDNFKGYNPENCKWSTRKQQSGNKRVGLTLLHAFGKAMTLSEWVKSGVCVVSENTLRQRLDAGHFPEVALTSSRSQLRVAHNRGSLDASRSGLSKAGPGYYG